MQVAKKTFDFGTRLPLRHYLSATTLPNDTKKEKGRRMLDTNSPQDRPNSYRQAPCDRRRLERGPRSQFTHI
jgi:hypothetical protein